MTTLSAMPPSSPPRPFYGPTVLAATFVLAIFGWGVGFYGPPVYLQSVVARTGWSVALVSAMVTLHFLAGALVVARLPMLYRRFGVPAVTLGGAVALAFGVTGWGLAGSPAQLALAALASGVGWVALGAAAVNALVAPWYAARRPWALGIAYNGASVGGILFAPLWVALIARWGLAGAGLAVGITMVAVVGVLAWRVFRHTPATLGQAADGAVSVPQPAAAAGARPAPARAPLVSPWRERRFRTLALGMALGLFAQIGLIAQLYGWLAARLGLDAAGWLMGAATAAAIAGRMGVARVLGPGADRRAVACTAYAVQGLGVALLSAAAWGALAHPAWLVAGVLLFGSGIGNATSLPPLIAQAEFAPADVSRAVPLIVAFSQGAYAFAPALFGVAIGLLPGGGWLVAALLLQLAAIAVYARGRAPRR